MSTSISPPFGSHWCLLCAHPLLCQCYIHQKKSWGHLHVTSGAAFFQLRIRWTWFIHSLRLDEFYNTIYSKINCNLFFLIDQDDKLAIRIEWFPNYSELKRALETYGFLFNFSLQTELVNTSKFASLFATFMINRV